MQIDQEKIPKLLIHFALPAMIGMIAGAVYNIVDRIFVGRYVGTDGLAATTLSFPVMLLMFSFSLLIGVGGSSRVAILRGARKQRPAEQALAHTLTLLAAVGFAGMALSIFGVTLSCGFRAPVKRYCPWQGIIFASSLSEALWRLWDTA